MLKSLFLFFFITAIYIHPVFAQVKPLHLESSLTFYSKQSLDQYNHSRSSTKGTLKVNAKYNLNNSSTKLALNYDGFSRLNFDGSYFQYISGIATYGIGSINRHWSFSDKTSLILSENARPSKSIYIQLKDRFDFNWLPLTANWSFEIFNGVINESPENKNSMLLGARAILSPAKGLNFEIIQTSQWGGKNYDNDISAFGAALFLDTNNSSNSNINKMAGFGISYLIPNKFIPLRIYGQAIGEDEAGNLPSCYAYLTGLEWSNNTLAYPIKLGIEAVDTRTKATKHGFCGPNSFYNNNIYNYSNYGNTLGAAIGTEGISLEAFGQTQLSQEVNVEYSTKAIIINDKNWTDHPYSSQRKSGAISRLGLSWKRGSISFNGNIYYQDFILEKQNIKSGYGIGLSSAIIF